MITEFFDSVPLSIFIRQNENLRKDEINSILLQIISGLCYLHENNILHQDFNVNNILINEKTHDIKIIDFGVSQKITERDIDLIMDHQGNFRFRVPKECLKESKSCYFSDIWGLCLIGLSLFMKKPLSSKEALKSQFIDQNVVESMILRDTFKQKNKDGEICELLEVLENRYEHSKIL